MLGHFNNGESERERESCKRIRKGWDGRGDYMRGTASGVSLVVKGGVYGVQTSLIGSHYWPTLAREMKAND